MEVILLPVELVSAGVAQSLAVPNPFLPFWNHLFPNPMQVGFNPKKQGAINSVRNTNTRWVA